MGIENDFQRRIELVEMAKHRLAETATLSDVIGIVKTSARSISRADGVTFVLRDGECCHYVDEDAIAPLWKGQKFPMTSCISGWCMLNGAPAVIEDVFSDPRIPHDVYRRTFVKSLLMVPVKVPEPIGAIGTYWAERHQFSNRDIEIMEALADAVATTGRLALTNPAPTAIASAA
jgi:GAF domain-containing protein